MNIAADITATIGRTPLVRLNRLVKKGGAQVLCKLEFFNPSSSVKDRIAVNMIDEAERSGRLKPGGVIIEATNGNTGVGLSMVAAARGYKLIITMSESMSRERRALMRQFGAEIILTEAGKGMAGAIARAEEILRATPGAFMPHQFDNPDNPAIHERTTAREIWDDTEGRIDFFVSGIGTGGTISGVGKVLKEQRRDIRVYGVEPEESPILSGGEPGPHLIQGIGAGFKPGILDLQWVDDIIRVKSVDAIAAAKALAAREGILAGISSGAAVKAALDLAAQEQNAGKTIVTIICDTGERYLSTDLFAPN